MLDPWEELPVSTTFTVPRWMIDFAREQYGEPELDVGGLVNLWVENMIENTYDWAREEGKLPEPPLGESSPGTPHSPPVVP